MVCRLAAGGRRIQDAASVAGLLITTEAMVGDRPEPKSAPGMPPGGMDY
jgi:chaperonin GroEL